MYQIEKELCLPNDKGEVMKIDNQTKYKENPFRFFKNTFDVLKTSRLEKLRLINKVLNHALSCGEDPLTNFRAIAGSLSGAECAYADYVWNIFGNDTSREVGEPITKTTNLELSPNNIPYLNM